MTVAVIDTGVDYNNPALGGGFGPNAKVIAGYNFASNTPDPMATTSQHGTAVAGLIGSDQIRRPGRRAGRQDRRSAGHGFKQFGQSHQHRQRPSVGHQQSYAIQHQCCEHVVVRWRQLRTELVRS